MDSNFAHHLNNMPEGALPNKQELIRKINKHLGYDEDHMRLTTLPEPKLDLIYKMLTFKPSM